MNVPLLYRAALHGVFGKQELYCRSSITDALFVYLDGEPEPESIAQVNFRFRDRPLVCLTKAWEERIKANCPDAVIYRRTMMKPACRFTIPEDIEIQEEYRLAGMDEAAFELHPFFHAAFRHAELLHCQKLSGFVLIARRHAHIAVGLIVH